jgi:hypothetical protein
MASPADPNRATNDLLRRVPPHSVEAEQAVLGGIFIRNSVFHTLVDTLSSDDFYLPTRRCTPASSNSIAKTRPSISFR